MEWLGTAFVPSFDEQYDQKYGQKLYEGEVDEQGKACGSGKAGQFDGTYYNNKPHGLSE